MTLEIPIATLMVKKGMDKKNVILLISIINIILYIMLLIVFNNLFHSIYVLIGGIIFLTIVFFLRLRFLKTYLRKI